MKVFVWKRIDEATDNYHTEGGVVVFAESLERAMELANAIAGCSIKESEKPDEIRNVDGDSEAVYIMRDTGCC
jgi:hypothetical protein